MLQHPSLFNVISHIQQNHKVHALPGPFCKADVIEHFHRSDSWSLSLYVSLL